MGIEGFSSFISKTFGTSVSLLRAESEILLIDCNFIFHQIGDLIFSTLSPDQQTTQTMCSFICSKLTSLIYHIAPTKAVYLAIDGVPGYCKQIVNRKHHFKSFFYPWKQWNSSLLCVGTSFNSTLCQYIRDYFQETKLYIRKSLLKIMVNDSSIPGEGEHKITEFIRQDRSYKSYVIYSPDSDLFLLSFFLSKHNLALVHPSISNTKNRTSYTIFDLHKLKHMWIQIFHPISRYIPLHHSTILTNNAISFHFFGNDFLPSIPCLSLQTSIVQSICQCNINIEHIQPTLNSIYDVTSLIEQHNNEIQFNRTALLSFLWRLSQSEPFLFLEKYRQYQTLSITPSRRDILLEQSMRGDYRFDLTFYRQRYYKEKFKTDEPSFINHICEKYLQGILFTTIYYMKSIPSYDWYYPYPYAPLFIDLYQYVKNLELLHYTFEFKNAMSGKECLASILHPVHFSLLPPLLEERLERQAIINDHYFPDSLSIDTSGQKYEWKSVVHVPMIPYNLVKQWCHIS